MKILITGGCGFVGSNLAIFLKKKIKKSTIVSLDNLSRSGSVLNCGRLKKNNIKNYKIDITNEKAIEKLPKFNLVIDCCAEAAVEISKFEMDRVFNTNLVGTFNILKKCSKDNSQLIYLSSSRVFSIEKLNSLKNRKKTINEKFDTNQSKSIYGFTKYSSEHLIREFQYLYKIKYIINRLGVISGPWQFGKQDQGFVSLWIWKHFIKGKLKYIGYGGKGIQIRDIIHIDDVCELIALQIKKMNKINNILLNVGGGKKNSLSLSQLTKLCQKITSNKIKIYSQKLTSNYDIPYYITDNSKLKRIYKWEPKKDIIKIINDIYIWMKLNKNILRKYI